MKIIIGTETRGPTELLFSGCIQVTIIRQCWTRPHLFVLYADLQEKLAKYWVGSPFSGWCPHFWEILDVPLLDPHVLLCQTKPKGWNIVLAWEWSLTQQNINQLGNILYWQIRTLPSQSNFFYFNVENFPIISWFTLPKPSVGETSSLKSWIRHWPILCVLR